MSLPPSTSAPSSSAGAVGGSLWLPTAVDRWVAPEGQQARELLSGFLADLQAEGASCIVRYSDARQLVQIAKTSVTAEQSMRTGCYIVQAMVLVQAALLERDAQQRQPPTQDSTGAGSPSSSLQLEVNQTQQQQPLTSDKDGHFDALLRANEAGVKSYGATATATDGGCGNGTETHRAH